MRFHSMYAVLFDIDGTLIQTGGAGQLAFAEVFQEEFGVDELSGEVSFAGRSDRAIAEEIMLTHGVENTAGNWRRFQDSYRLKLPNTLRRCPGSILPGVVELLDRLDQFADVALGLLTGNVALGADAKLGHYGIRDRFGFGGFGDRRTDRNDIAADALGAARDQPRANGNLRGAMVIGDTVNDVRCGQSIGAFTVAVATGGATAEALAASEPDLLLNDLTDIDSLLAEVRSK